MKVEKHKIQEAIGYEKICEEIHADYHRFDIMPEDDSLPKAYLAFGITSGSYYLLQAGFGEWHTHFDDHEEEDKNVDDAISFLKNIISGEYYVIVEADAKGKYVGGSLIMSPDGLNHLRPTENRRRKMCFNKPIEELENTQQQP